MTKNDKEVIYLIDGNAYIHRAYHALPPLATHSGIPINAVFGFVRMLFKILKNFKPKYICICFDSFKPTFRHEIFKEYKATRKEIEEDLKLQFPIVYEFVEKSKIPFLIIDGYEADDVIASLATNFKDKHEIVIISGDKDILQLVDEKIKVYNEHKEIWYDEKKVDEKYGVSSKQLVDYFVLVGDKSDNIAGVEGVGPKTASNLIKKFGNLEAILKDPKGIEEKIRQKISQKKEELLKNKNLIELVKDIETIRNISLEKLFIKSIDFEEIKKFLLKYDMRSILKELDKLKNIIDVSREKKINLDLFENTKNENKINIKEQSILFINNGKDIEETFKILENAERISFSLLAKNEELKTTLVGCVILAKNKKFEKLIYFKESINNKEKFLQFILKLLNFQEKLIITFDLKTQLKLLLENYSENIKISKQIFDILILAYLTNPNRKFSSLQELCSIYLNNAYATDFILPKEINLEIFPIDKLLNRILNSLESMIEIYYEIKKDLDKYKELINLYTQIELPIVNVLVKMEKFGIAIDQEYANNLLKEITKTKQDIEKKIIEVVGFEINLNSPKQLGFLLFEKLKLPPVKRKKTGFSTDEEVLSKLKDLHPLIPLLIQYRELEKLKNTYLEPILKYVNPNTSRIITNFNPIGTSTGRLSSENPNLQNIPVKTELGKKIRNIFIAEKNFKLVSIDYSQIELRILAHFSEDYTLINAFYNNKDIHKTTASEVLGIKEEEVTEDLRRMAKIINFGIIYGMTPQRLAKELNITNNQAQQLIQKYFEKYSGVKKWIEETIKFTRLNGYAKTLLGRIRPIPEINSSNKSLKAFAERLAINTPIQGTAADIIKLAMLKIDKYIENNSFQNKVKMLLQIHDELIFEIQQEILEKSVKELKSIMENVISLKVPLIADVKISDRWGEI